jgi:hypothetical protein
MFDLLFAKTLKSFLRDGKHGKTGHLARFEMVCSVDLLLTLIVFWFLLAPGIFNMGAELYLFSFENLAVHMITPLLCLIDYFLFAEHGHLKYRDVYAILIFPLAYLTATSIAGLLGYSYGINPVDGKPTRFPYFFFDYDRVGADSIFYVAVLVGIFLVFSHLLYIVDRKRKKSTRV